MESEDEHPQLHALHSVRPQLSFLYPALAEHTVFVVSVRNGSRRVRNGSHLTGVPWDLRLAGHTSATHTFLVLVLFPQKNKFRIRENVAPLVVPQRESARAYTGRATRHINSPSTRISTSFAKQLLGNDVCLITSRAIGAGRLYGAKMSL